MSDIIIILTDIISLPEFFIHSTRFNYATEQKTMYFNVTS